MNIQDNDLPQLIYSKCLLKIGDISFTPREIDIIAFIISGRSAKRTGILLSLSQKTVESYTRNIMIKLECNSKEGIIDFIEKSDQFANVKRYHTSLLMQLNFEKILKSIALIPDLDKEKKIFLVAQEEEIKSYFIENLIKHINIVGLSLSQVLWEPTQSFSLFNKHDSKNEFTIYFISNLHSINTLIDSNTFLLQQNTQASHRFFLFSNDEIFKQCSLQLNKLEHLKYDNGTNYYSTVFNILQKIFPNIKLDSYINEFIDQNKQNTNITQTPHTEVQSRNEKKFYDFSFKTFIILFILILCILSATFFWALKGKKQIERPFIHSNLSGSNNIPHLNRYEIIHQIKKEFEKASGIHAIALIGVGGAGKTTLARQYVSQQKASIMWEFSTETPQSLNASFDKLGQKLSQSDIDHKLLKNIQMMSSLAEKETKLIQFVKDRLKLNPNWFLIYDNVESFDAIQKYFPNDSTEWGEGKILLTSRNSNIENSKYINHVIHIGELSSKEKLDLFAKITSSEMDNLRVNHNKDVIEFVKKLPPFPLDISLAAYYLKATQMPFNSYLENLETSNKDFASVQENILKEVGSYTKTRENIVILALQDIFKKHKDFPELLLLISMIDSQEIPRDLLDCCKNSVVVSNFIYNLKKYSLITSKHLNSTHSSSTISIHRNTQLISLSYLKKVLDLEKNKDITHNISNCLMDYGINKVVIEADLAKMKALNQHLHKFLSHKHLLESRTEATLEGEMGIIEYFYGDNIKAKRYLENSLNELNKLPNTSPVRIALFMGYLGNVYRDLGHYARSKKLLEESIGIYDKNYPQEIVNHSYFLIYLGIVERILGNYNNAKAIFYKGLDIQRQFFPENKNYFAWVKGQLAIIDRELGNYEDSQAELEKSMITFKDERSNTHFDVAWGLEHLGVLYFKCGNYAKAKDSLEQSIKIYSSYFFDEVGINWALENIKPPSILNKEDNSKKIFDQICKKYSDHFHENYIYTAWPMKYLALVYAKQGNFIKAKVILEQVLKIYLKNFGKEHITVAVVLNMLGEICFLERDEKSAESYFVESSKLFEKNNHPDYYMCLENLSDLYLYKAKIAYANGDTHAAITMKNHSIDYLKQSLTILQNYFPSTCPHIARTRRKIEFLMQNS
ncbi:MAG: tetratricopeptide repeat protein [Alphaproteobacteria bacterium]|nr:tetratricopeptide repeat protein [Alphaproteobacteria bacterium]